MLTVESLVAELGLTLATGEDNAQASVRWVHSTELLDPTPWLRGGELLLTTGLQLSGARPQREFVERLHEREIAGLGFGTGLVHKKVPAAVLNTARKLGFPLFEVPYELPFIAVTERVFAQLLNERYELLQRNMAGDVLAEALTGRLYPDELQARLRPFGIGESAAVLAFALREPSTAASTLEAILERAGAHSLVALRNGLLCAVVDCENGGPPTRARRTPSGASTPPSDASAPAGDSREEPVELARRVRSELQARFGEVRAAASRPSPTHNLRRSFHEARCALEAVRVTNGGAPEVASYKDLGAFQLLLSLQDDDALASYCQSVLGPVESDEGEYGDELLRSLDVFIEQNGHWERAAQALYCHRHTLRYRIKRIEQLTGRDFSRARDRIEFWLALRGRELAR
ncbi:MAG TPA: PucR family transcriptional regulator ligand-binding domain-containing protein [Solirubrobacteraceae bacterium]|jgi:purine catabolism regulator|nr:PucR family transcriptional regulator ligand-binding domain-containing protein [Solirubrobacteraceae bacterium]